jgi:hypothetical protein
MKYTKLARILLFGLVAGALAASAEESSSTRPNRPRVRIGGLVVGAGYSSGPSWYPYYGYGPSYGFGFYNPLWYSPYFHPGLFNGFMQQPNMGRLKLTTPAKDASVYLDGAYAGSAQKLKSFWLSPGVYNLELRDENQQAFRQKVYVLSGRTLAIRATLQPDMDKESK